MVLSGAATADSMSLEVSGPSSGQQGEGATVSELPADSWLALAVPMIGEAISAGYEGFVQSFEAGLKGVEGQGLKGIPGGIPGDDLPDIKAEIKRAIGLDLEQGLRLGRGYGPCSSRDRRCSRSAAALVIETDDEQAAAAALSKLRRALGRQRDLRIVEDAGRLSDPDAGSAARGRGRSPRRARWCSPSPASASTTSSRRPRRCPTPRPSRRPRQRSGTTSMPRSTSTFRDRLAAREQRPGDP